MTIDLEAIIERDKRWVSISNRSKSQAHFDRHALIAEVKRLKRVQESLEQQALDAQQIGHELLKAKDEALKQALSMCEMAAHSGHFEHGVYFSHESWFKQPIAVLQNALKSSEVQG